MEHWSKSVLVCLASDVPDGMGRHLQELLSTGESTDPDDYDRHLDHRSHEEPYYAMAQREWALDWRRVIFHLLDMSLIFAGGVGKLSRPPRLKMMVEQRLALL